jgi:frataxin-like iron-binding protein CyaY
MAKEQLSQKLLEEIIASARTSGKHYTSLHKEWINKAQSELGN